MIAHRTVDSAGRSEIEEQQLPIRVVLAEDHPVMRHALRQLLEREQGIEVLADTFDLASTATQLDLCQPSVLVLDLRLRGSFGTDSIRRLRERAPGMKIVALTMHEHPAFAEHVLAQGASAFVIKDFADTDLPAAVLAVSRDETYVSPRIASRSDQ